jgi:hypothetical protein
MERLRILSISMIMAISQLLNLNGQNSTDVQEEMSSKNVIPIKYKNITNLSYGIGVGEGFEGSKGHRSYGIHTINGCLINSKWGLGIGIGLDRLQLEGDLGQTILPISLDIRYYFLKDPKILFCDIEWGYTYNLSGKKLDYESGLGGYFIDPSIGARIISFNKTSIVTSIGLKIQKNTIRYVYTPLPTNEKIINFKVGLEF